MQEWVPRGVEGAMTVGRVNGEAVQSRSGGEEGSVWWSLTVNVELLRLKLKD